MPVTAINPAITTLGQSWTHESLVSAVMVETNTFDNERIQLANHRAILNQCLAKIVELLNIAHMPFYGSTFVCQLEAAPHPNGLEWVDLSTPVGGAVIPYRAISDVVSVNVPGGNWDEWSNPQNATELFTGNFAKWDMRAMLEQNRKHNVQHRQSIAWYLHGKELMLYVGADINLPSRNSANYNFQYELEHDKIVMEVYRNPILDDLLPRNTSVTYRQPIDLPDRYADLLINMCSRKVYGMMNAQVPAQMQQEINVELAKLDQNVAMEVQNERANRDKRDYGDQYGTVATGTR